MKNKKNLCIAILTIALGSMVLSSCSSFSNEENYNNGYMIGRGLAPLFTR